MPDLRDRLNEARNRMEDVTNALYDATLLSDNEALAKAYEKSQALDKEIWGLFELPL